MDNNTIIDISGQQIMDNDITINCRYRSYLPFTLVQDLKKIKESR